ncbi:MAG: hypothetical protein SWZ49_11415, partial [Cyanobacteriota bacterium]|nr:hypothetical protein [Cyanobacteriota bacterium]
GTVELWSLKNGKFTKLKQFQKLLIDKAHSKPVWSVKFSPDGKMIATASDNGTVNLWNTNGQWKNTITAADDNFSVYDISFSPDGKTLITAGSDSKAKLFNLDGEVVRIFEDHSDDVSSVSFSPDGKIFATASSDSNIKVWNLDNGKLIQTLTSNFGKFFSVNFSPDGNNIAITSEDSSVIIWKLNASLKELKETSCQWLKDYLYNQDRYNPCS